MAVWQGGLLKPSIFIRKHLMWVVLLATQLGLSLLRNTGIELRKCSVELCENTTGDNDCHTRFRMKRVVSVLVPLYDRSWLQPKGILGRRTSVFDMIWGCMYSSCDRCIKMPQCELNITRRLPQANLLRVRRVRQGLCSFYWLINIIDNWLLFCTEMHLLHGWLPNCFQKYTSTFPARQLRINLFISLVF